MPLYAKAREMSHAHYDRGLEMAKVRNLSAAIDELRAALQINRKNIMARNLLGLCYYAMGRIGEALREWVISANYGADDDNLAKDYLIYFQDDMMLLEKYGDALYNYNEALQFMTQYSEDLAAIRLKRAVEINPDFVDALNLLALFYIRTGERQKAGALAERVLIIDAGNPFARRYYREVFQRKVPPSKMLRAQAEVTERNARHAHDSGMHQKGDRQNPFFVQSQRPMAKASPIYGLLLFVAGLGVMFLFMYILMLPSFLEDSLAQVDARTAELNTARTLHAEQISELNDIIEGLWEDLDDYQWTTALQEEQNLNLQNENRVHTAHYFLLQELPSVALASLEDVDPSRLSPEVLSRYNFIRQTATPVAEESYYQQGLIFFNAGEYEEARRNLMEADRHVTENSPVAHYVLYLLGNIAENEEDYSLAREYYERIINEFPDSNRANAANIRLAGLP
jgi:tetratricopeptide (TPR) repeat protein